MTTADIMEWTNCKTGGQTDRWGDSRYVLCVIRSTFPFLTVNDVTIYFKNSDHTFGDVVVSRGNCGKHLQGLWTHTLVSISYDVLWGGYVK